MAGSAPGGTLPPMTWSIEGRSVLITGGNAGIGRATARELAAQGANVTIGVRDRQKGLDTAHGIESETGRAVAVLVVDLADLGSVRTAASTFLADNERLDVLINNAGGFFGRAATTADGLERTWATNYVGPFLLTRLLLPLLVESAPARIINVGSSAHGSADEGIRFGELDSTTGYKMMDNYGHSKLANILHARELERRYGDAEVHAYSMHPGMVKTSIGSGGDSALVALAVRIAGWRWKTPEQGADTIVWLATVAEPPEPRGGYFEDRTEARSSRHARDDDMAARLWQVTDDRLARIGGGT